MRAPNKDTKMRNPIISAMYAQYETQYELAKVQVDVYLKNLVGVGEHIDFVGPIETKVKQMAELKDMMDALENFF